MIREVIKIDEDLCDGCGKCIPGCHEGALQLIDAKARLVSELMCDGLGACIGHCPRGAISIERRDAEPYKEIFVMKMMIKKGANTVIAHMKHLRDHNENELLEEARKYLVDNSALLDFDSAKVISEVYDTVPSSSSHPGGGCPGTMTKDLSSLHAVPVTGNNIPLRSELSHWPVQMHLINPAASHYRDADLLLAADCVAYTVANFHGNYLKGRKLAIACPKLDHGTDIYIDKIRRLIDEAMIRSMHLVVMEVPCCSGLRRMVDIAREQARRTIHVDLSIVSIRGEVINSTVK